MILTTSNFNLYMAIKINLCNVCISFDECVIGQEIYSNIPGDVSISSHNSFQDTKDIWSSAPSDAKVTRLSTWILFLLSNFSSLFARW